MARTATIQARVDPEIKSKAQEILNRLQISMSEAISLYLAQVSLHRGIPFELKIPNELTEETIAKSEKGVETHEVSSVDLLFENLEN